MISYNFNPHTTHNSSRRVNSQVVSLALKDDIGDALIVSDLPSDIQINIPLSEPEHGNTTSSEYFLNSGDMQYRVITAREANTTFKVSMTTEKPASITAFVKFGERPTERSYDEVIELSDGDRFNGMDSDCELNCSQSIFINCNLPGDYHIGLLYHNKNSTVHSRGRRSLLFEQESQEKCVKFKDPPPTKPPPTESSVIIPQYDIETSLNYSLNVESIWCAYWSDAEKRWTSEGCKVRRI